MTEPFNSIEHAVAVGRRTGVIMNRPIGVSVRLCFRVTQPGWSAIERAAYWYLVNHHALPKSNGFDTYIPLTRVR